MQRILLIAVLLSACSLATQAATSVWKVHKGGDGIYIGGTVHLLRASDFPLPPEFDIAYEDSDRIFFETDISALSDPSTQEKMARVMLAKPGHTIDTQLSSKTLDDLSIAAANSGLNLDMLKPFKVSMIITMLEVAELMRLGMNLEGVDIHFNERAIADGRPIEGLETVDLQLDYLSRMGEGNEEEFVQLSLRDLENLEEISDQLIVAWRNGDRKQLDALFIQDMKGDFPQIYEQLLVQRNNNWMPEITGMFNEPGTEYVLVGVGHLVGQDGILQRLEKQGYTVTPVN